MFENEAEEGGDEVSDPNDQGAGVGIYHVVFTLKVNFTNNWLQMSGHKKPSQNGSHFKSELESPPSMSRLLQIQI